MRAELEAKLQNTKVELDAKMGGMKVELEAKMDGMNVELDARMEGMKAELEAKMERMKVELEARMEGIKADLEAATKEREQLARQEKCQEMRNYATGLSSGMRVSRASPDGTAVRLNDDERSAELNRMNDSINQHCNS